MTEQHTQNASAIATQFNTGISLETGKKQVLVMVSAIAESSVLSLFTLDRDRFQQVAVSV